MTESERLFHLMARKMYDLATEGDALHPDEGFHPDDQDVADVLIAASLLVNEMEQSECTKLAAATAGIAAGELSDDMGYHINERGDAITNLLEVMCEVGILEPLAGDDHVAYLRR